MTDYATVMGQTERMVCGQSFGSVENPFCIPTTNLHSLKFFLSFFFRSKFSVTNLALTFDRCIDRFVVSFHSLRVVGRRGTYCANWFHISIAFCQTKVWTPF